ncbi:MAG: response regulator [Bacteroidales bacterium]|nr:response regulator [Bacteroidales bacterium]MDD4384532.1 response regulator [Bacteroidales bacterium]MDY0197463.1 response regulator [Tenuifilaceae bacterium]
MVFNALKFTQKGTIEFGYNLKDNFLKFFVADTGIGIPSDKFETIFERFQLVENGVSQSRNGTGLGLPISRAFAELLGGKIWLTSELGEGTTFYFTIPYLPMGESKGISHKLPEKLCELKNIVVLIAEDDEPNYLYLKELLKTTGAIVLRAKNGREAVDVCLNQKVDIVLMDIKMPVMDGLEATQELRGKGVEIPIIVQTAYALSEDRAKITSVGCNYHISKPINQAELFSALEQMLTI